MRGQRNFFGARGVRYRTCVGLIGCLRHFYQGSARRHMPLPFTLRHRPTEVGHLVVVLPASRVHEGPRWLDLLELFGFLLHELNSNMHMPLGKLKCSVLEGSVGRDPHQQFFMQTNRMLVRPLLFALHSRRLHLGCENRASLRGREVVLSFL